MLHGSYTIHKETKNLLLKDYHNSDLKLPNATCIFSDFKFIVNFMFLSELLS